MSTSRSQAMILARPRRSHLLALAAMCFALVVATTGKGQPMEPDEPARLRPLPIEDVSLTGGPLLHAQDLNAAYLLGLEVDRLAAPYRMRAGLDTDARGYGGWESYEGKQLTGHIAGHYLSAASLMYARTGDERFRERVDALVEALAEVQAARGNGYLGANADAQGTDGMRLMEQVAAGDIRSGGFDLNGLWAPWYTYHKTYAGLRDAYRFCGNEKALELEVGLAHWAESILAGLSHEQLQQMLACEFGGMNEVLVDLYADTGDERWLALSRAFEHDAVVGPMVRGRDELGGTHANTQVPKFLGSLDRYLATGAYDDRLAAEFFWERVVGHHTFVTGGHGQNEYFNPPDTLGQHFSGRTAESCNVYNMLKLTRRLFEVDPDPKYAAYLETALYNHALAAIHPETGSTTYMVPVGQYVTREYADMQHNFTCCVGSGMENHALHASGIFYEEAGALWVTFYAPAEANWRTQGVAVAVETDLPLGEDVSLTVAFDGPPKTFSLYLIRPAWAEDGFALSINGEALSGFAGAGSFIEVHRAWSSGDRVELTLPKRLTFERVDDTPAVGAVMWGPLVMAGDLSTAEAQGRSGDYLRLPVLIEPAQDASGWLEPVAGSPGRFSATSVLRPYTVTFEPFYLLHGKPYTVYWDSYTPEQWEREQSRVVAEQARAQALQERTVAYIQLGEQQPEQDHQFRYEWSFPIRTENRPGRYANNWFSLRVPIDPDHPNVLSLTYYDSASDKRGRVARFSILIDGEQIATETIRTDGDGVFYQMTYDLPQELLEGKDAVEVRLQSVEGGQVGPVYGVRMLRGE